MGAHAYWYVVKYRPDLDEALQELRQREFTAGRYHPVTPFLEFPVTAQSPAPGAQHATIEDALEDSAEDGTRSILDISSIADEPDFCCAAPLEPDVLEDLYGTTQPTRAAVEANLDFLEDVERGHAVYVLLYRNGRPDEILFAGYSFD